VSTILGRQATGRDERVCTCCHIDRVLPASRVEHLLPNARNAWEKASAPKGEHLSAVRELAKISTSWNKDQAAKTACSREQQTRTRDFQQLGIGLHFQGHHPLQKLTEFRKASVVQRKGKRISPRLKCGFSLGRTGHNFHMFHTCACSTWKLQKCQKVSDKPNTGEPPTRPALHDRTTIKTGKVGLSPPCDAQGFEVGELSENWPRSASRPGSFTTSRSG
jgi:hypothetical protein